MPDGGLLVFRSEYKVGDQHLGLISVEYRLRADGSIDDSFPKIEADGFYGLIFLPQPDGKLLAYSSGGEGASLNGQRMPLFFRLNADGTVDSGFTPTSDLIGRLDFRFWVLPDGKLLLGAWVNSFYQLRRLHADGSLDTTFQAPADLFPTGFAPGVHPLADGHIFVRSRSKLNRLRQDGSIDADFVTGDIVLRHAIAPSMTIEPLDRGRILLLGEIRSYNGVTANGIVPLEPNGAVDTSFRSGQGFGQADGSPGSPGETWPLPGGRFLVGGGFDRYDGQAVTPPIVLNADGTRDLSFVASLGSWVRGVSEGRAIIWTPEGLDRLTLPTTETPTPPRIAAVTRDADNIARLTVEATSGTRYTLQSSETLTNWTDLTTQTATTNRIDFTDAPTNSPRMRFYRVKQN